MGSQSFHALFPVKKYQNIFLLRKFLIADPTNILPIVRNLFFGCTKYIEKNRTVSSNKVEIKLLKSPMDSVDQLWEKKRDEYQSTNVRNS